MVQNLFLQHSFFLESHQVAEILEKQERPEVIWYRQDLDQPEEEYQELQKLIYQVPGDYPPLLIPLTPCIEDYSDSFYGLELFRQSLASLEEQDYRRLYLLTPLIDSCWKKFRHHHCTKPELIDIVRAARHCFQEDLDRSIFQRQKNMNALPQYIEGIEKDIQQIEQAKYHVLAITGGSFVEQVQVAWYIFQNLCSRYLDVDVVLWRKNFLSWNLQELDIYFQRDYLEWHNSFSYVQNTHGVFCAFDLKEPTSQVDCLKNLVREKSSTFFIFGTNLTKGFSPASTQQIYPLHVSVKQSFGEMFREKIHEHHDKLNKKWFRSPDKNVNLWCLNFRKKDFSQQVRKNQKAMLVIWEQQAEHIRNYFLECAKVLPDHIHSIIENAMFFILCGFSQNIEESEGCFFSIPWKINHFKEGNLRLQKFQQEIYRFNQFLHQNFSSSSFIDRSDFQKLMSDVPLRLRKYLCYLYTRILLVDLLHQGFEQANVSTSTIIEETWEMDNFGEYLQKVLS